MDIFKRSTEANSRCTQNTNSAPQAQDIAIPKNIATTKQAENEGGREILLYLPKYGT